MADKKIKTKASAKPRKTAPKKQTAVQAAKPRKTVAKQEKIAHTAKQAMPSRQEIERLARSYWAARGCQDGFAEEDWLRAERELLKKAS